MPGKLRRHPLGNRLVLAALWGCLAVPAWAQPGPPTWWSLDSYPPGTPPTVVFQLSESSTQQTVLYVTIHGFWYQTIQVAGQTFRKLSLDQAPPNAVYYMIGRPELPAMHHTFATLSGDRVGTPVVQVIDETTINNALIFPYQGGTPDHPGEPVPPFHWDQAFYEQTTTPYPIARALAIGIEGMAVGLQIGTVETHPFRYVPAAQTLYVTKRLKLTIPHPGSLPLPTEAPSRLKALQLSRMLVNWPLVDGILPDYPNGSWGDYLIVTQPEYVDEIEPLAEQKRWRNYAVTVITTEGETCDQIRERIVDWYRDTQWSHNEFVLLVGADIPMCDSESGLSDKLYACLHGLGWDDLPDPFVDVYLGRLPCRDESECTDMVTKILRYESHDFAGGNDWLDDVLLVAHKGFSLPMGWISQYFWDQEWVRQFDYANPPVFHTAYAREEGATNDDIITEWNTGRGVIGYRGQGRWWCWANWTDAGDDFSAFDLLELNNGERTPVVFGITESTTDLAGWDGCLGEHMLKTTQRAVAYIGASGTAWYFSNSVLDRDLFKAIYADGHLIIGEALAAAEQELINDEPVDGEACAWTYNTFGDPEMEIWREDPAGMQADGYPYEIGLGSVELIIRVRDLFQRSPIEGAAVAVYKEGEVGDNRYTDAEGLVRIPINPRTPGTIRLTVYTEFESHGVIQDEIRVVDPGSSVIDAAGLPARLLLEPARPNPFVPGGNLRFGLPQAGRATLSVYDAGGRRVATVWDGDKPAGWHSVPWDGRDALGQPLTAGVYFSRLVFGEETRTGRLMIMP